MPDSFYGARLQGFTVVVFIVAKSRAWFDEYIYHDSLQARAIEGIRHCSVSVGTLDKDSSCCNTSFQFPSNHLHFPAFE